MDNPNWYFKVQIFGEDWTMYIIDDDDNVIADKDSGAETDVITHEITFRKGCITLPIVLHELWHAYFSYTYTSTADLDFHQTEEVSAEIFADQGTKIVLQATDIYNKLIELRDIA